MSRRGRRFRLADRIGSRLALLLAVALLPLGIISTVRSNAVLREATARAEAALLGETMRAVEHEVKLIQRAQGAAGVLAEAVRPLLDEPATCSAMLARAAGASTVYSFIGYFGTDGRSTCLSTGKTLELTEAERDRARPAYERPTLRVAPKGRISGTAVVLVTHPVRDEEGRRLGFVSVSVPHSTLIGSGERLTDGSPTVLMTFNGEGEILTSSVGLENAQRMLPWDREPEQMTGTRGLAFTSEAVGGGLRVFSVAPIVPGSLYALGSWTQTGGSMMLRTLPAYFLPALMWLVCLVVSLFAAERLMTRHIRRLRAAIASFAKGSRMVDRMDFSSAPREIRELADSFARMTETILYDEAELEDMVHQKEVLLREVHHRVKNNLQLIASIMNMQMRQARTPEAKGLMKGLQDRVMSLATIHRGLYQTTGLTDIRADELLPDIVRQVVNLGTGPGRPLAVQTDFGDLRLTPDQAVPLALLLTEALTNVMKYAGSQDGDMPRLFVSLRPDSATTAVLEVANTVGHEPPSPETLAMGTGLGAQLLAGFAQQVGGEIRSENDGRIHRLSVRFEVRPLADAEARNAPVPA